MLLNPARDDTTRVFEKIEDVTALIGGRFNWRPGIGWYPKWSFNCVDAYLEETPNFYRRSRLIDFEIQVDREDGGQQPEGILNPSVMFSLDAIISKRPEEIADQVLKIMTPKRFS